MKILFLTHRLPYPPNRGDRIRSYRLLSHLAKQADVDVLSLVHSDEEERLAPSVREIARRVEVARVSRPGTLMRALTALPGSTPLTHVLLDSPALPAALERLVATGRPDVVLAYCSGMARLALVPPLDAIPLVLDMVDVDSEKWRALADTSHGPMRWVYRREARRLREFERAATAHARVTLVVNERERASMVDVNPSARIEVLSNGIDVDRFRPEATPERRPDVVFCGVFSYEPNERGAVWLAREVWPLVTARRPDATLSLVGMDPSRAVRALASIPGVRVTGTVTDVRPYLWGASLSAAPLLVARGLQNKVLEAIAAELPCVVTSQVAGGLQPGVLSACRIADDAGRFADAILELLHLDSDALRALARSAPLQQLTWDYQFDGLMELMAEASSATC